MNMLRKLLLLITVIIFNCKLNSQNTFGTTFVNENVYDGYTLVSIHKKVFLINNCGELVKEWTSNYLPGNAVYLLPNGNILRAGRVDDNTSTINFGGVGGVVELFDWSGNLIWYYRYHTNNFRQHHDVYPMPNGNVLILAATRINTTDAIEAGRNPSNLSNIDLYNERIIEVEPSGFNQGNIVWEWNLYDHLIQDFDATKGNFGIVADNPGKLDINFLNGHSPASNWIHANSIQYNEERDQIVISSRKMSELWIIDHTTTTNEAAGNTGGIYGKGGDFLYRWGNPQAYRQGNESNRKLFGQHMPYIIPSGIPNAGKIITFNNGFGRTPNYSQIDIITPPTSAPGFYTSYSNSAYGPNNTDLTFPEIVPTENTEFYSNILSSAQQLPNGNILVCQGRQGYFFEIDSNNNIVWEYVLPIDVGNGSSFNQGDTAPEANFCFRAIKYGENYPAFDNIEIDPGEPLENNPNIDFCSEILSDNRFEEIRVSVYPNPTSNFINIKTNLDINKIEIYNIFGSRVHTNNNSKKINLSNLESNVYFIKIHTNNSVISKKVIKQ